MLSVVFATATIAGPPSSTAFTYQGQLKRNGSPVTDTCDIDLALFDSASTGVAIAMQTIFKVVIVNGLFTVQPDFGIDRFDGSPRYLEITVDCGAPGATVLSPRQEITPTPESMYSQKTRGIHVSGAGNAGIGTTSPGARLTLSRPTQSASYQLELRNEGSIQIPNFDGIVFTQGINGGTELGSIKLMYRNTGKPDLSFGVRDRPDALYIHGNESGRGGNVGIGTTVPASKLEVVSDSDPTLSLKSSSSSGQDTGLSIRGARNGTTTADIASIDLRNFDDNESDGTDFAMARIAGGMADASGQTGYLRFKTNDGTGLKEQLRIDKQGNVGLGTDTPTERLDVNGNIKIEGDILLSTRTGHVSISPYAFQNLLNTRFGNLGTFTNFPAVMNDVVSETFYAAANVQLPQGAQLVGLTARICDDADPGDLRISFWKTVYDDLNGIHFTAPIVEVDSTGAQGKDTISVAIVPSQTVSHGGTSYYVSFESIGETLPDVAVSLFNVTIEYEISRLRP